MSFTATIFPIIAALSAPEGSYFNTNNKWFCFNDIQTHFIENFFSKKSELSQFNKSELQSWVSKDHNELNNIAQNHGFNINFDPFEEDKFGSLSILNIAVQWIKQGTISSIFTKDKIYKAAQLNDNYTVFETGNYPYPIVKINTQSNDVVYITIADKEIKEFALLQKINELKALVISAPQVHYDYVRFPHVVLNQKEDISWLIGMKCFGKNGNPWIIRQALQQTKFSMNEKGAHVESAVAVGFGMTTAFKSEININQPFYIWIERPGCSIPIFAGYIDNGDWIQD